MIATMNLMKEIAADVPEGEMRTSGNQYLELNYPTLIMVIGTARRARYWTTTTLTMTMKATAEALPLMPMVLTMATLMKWLTLTATMKQWIKTRFMYYRSIRASSQ